MGIVIGKKNLYIYIIISIYRVLSKGAVCVALMFQLNPLRNGVMNT